MSTKDAYEKKLRGRLAEWRADIDKLKAKADQAEGESQLAYYREIENLRAKQDDVRDKLDNLREAGDGAWEDMKSGVEKAWSELSDSTSKALSRF